jgi:CRISPR-associated endonuclease/helicase Cas3
MRITTLPVYSQLANEWHIPSELKTRIPIDWQLSEHQVATYRALNSDAEVIFNVAITGDGKSLAGQLPTLVQSRHATMVMYPTNELIHSELTP